MSLLFFHASNLTIIFFSLYGCKIHCTLLNPTPEESKDKCQQTFAVDAVDGLALSAAFYLYLRLLHSVIVVKLQQHVDQLISSLLHQRTLSVETLGLSNTQLLYACTFYKYIKYAIQVVPFNTKNFNNERISESFLNNNNKFLFVTYIKRRTISSLLYVYWCFYLVILNITWSIQ